ncbi:MAG: hypothetical protein ABGX16_21045 [Pirellulales bacterium]
MKPKCALKTEKVCRSINWHKWLPITVLASMATLNLVGLLLVVRRFSGAFQEPFPTGPMVFTALISTTLVAYGRNAWRRHNAWLDRNDRHLKEDCYKKSRWASWNPWIGWGSSIGLVLMAVGCAYPGNQLSDWLIWIPLLVADQFWRQSFFDGGRPTIPLLGKYLPKTENLISTSDSTSHLISDAPASEILITDSLTTEEDEQLLQQLFRVRNQAGQETIYGTLRADFKKGQRNVSLHVGFCPPLPHSPQVEAEPVDGPAATLKVVHALAHGTRLDLRLDQPAHRDCHVLVDLAALENGG